MITPGWCVEHGDLVRRPDDSTLLVVRYEPGPGSYLWRGVTLRGGVGSVASSYASSEAAGVERAEAWYRRDGFPVPPPAPDEPGPWDSAELPCRRAYADGTPAAVVERGCAGLAVWTTYTREGTQAGSGALPADGSTSAAERARGVCDAWIARGCPASSRRAPVAPVPTPKPTAPPQLTPWEVRTAADGGVYRVRQWADGSPAAYVDRHGWHTWEPGAGFPLISALIDNGHESGHLGETRANAALRDYRRKRGAIATAPTLPSLPAAPPPRTDGPLLGVAHAIGRLRAIEAGLDELRHQVVETRERLEAVSREQLGGAS